MSMQSNSTPFNIGFLIKFNPFSSRVMNYETFPQEGTVVFEQGKKNSCYSVIQFVSGCLNNDF